MIKLDYVPNGLAAIEDWYGGPPAHVVDHKIVADKDWYKANMIRVQLPFPLRLSWDRTQAIRRPAVHKRIAPALIDALEEIRDYGGYEFLLRYDLELCGGIYAVRLQRGSSYKLTLHAYGIAIDLCPHLGPFHEPGRMPWFNC
jgi:hypothetical protein